MDPLQTKKLTTGNLSLITTLDENDAFVMTDASGNAKGMKTGTLQQNILGGISLDSMLDGIFIMYHDKSTTGNYTRLVKPSAWTSLQNGGQIADGVAVQSGDRLLIVAPTEATIYWSSADVTGGGTMTSDRATAIADWNGKSNTAAQILKDACSDAAYAPGYCAAYSRANANGVGLTAGKWWLPSFGELMMIYGNKNKINYALGLISGATLLQGVTYWSSTEYSSTNAWSLNLGIGGMGNDAKKSIQLRVRPVSAYIF